MITATVVQTGQATHALVFNPRDAIVLMVELRASRWTPLYAINASTQSVMNLPQGFSLSEEAMRAILKAAAR